VEWSVDLNKSKSKEARGRAKRKSEEGAHRHSYSYKGGALEAVRPVVSEPVVESGSSGSLATFLHHHHHGSTVHGRHHPSNPTALALRCTFSSHYYFIAQTESHAFSFFPLPPTLLLLPAGCRR